MHEREDANRTRVAGHLDEIQGCRGNHIEVASQWGRWFHRLVRWLRSHSQFAVVIGDIEVKRVLLSVDGGKAHNIEHTLVVLDGLDAM